MTVKDIIMLAAEMLGLKEKVDEYFISRNEENEKEVNTLVRCFNTVENELALDYFPLYCEDTVQTATGRVGYDELSATAIRILRVTDSANETVAHRIFPAYLHAEKPGTLKVSYTYAPKKKTIKDDSDYLLQVSESLLAYGIATEYCLCKGLFEEYAVWEKKYKDGISAAYRAKPSKIMRSRRWA